MSDIKPTPEQERAAREWLRTADCTPTNICAAMVRERWTDKQKAELGHLRTPEPQGIQRARSALARLLAEREAVLVERCKRLEEALGCVLDLDKLLGDTVLHHPKRNEWEQAYKGACREARAALEDK